MVLFLMIPTIAYFTASQRVKNIITTGSVSLDIIETDEKGNTFPLEGIKGVVPGSKITKDVKIHNSGENAMWIKVSINVYFANDLDNSVVDLNYNEKDWVFKDGFYHYKYILEPNKLTSSIFDTVYFKDTMDNQYKREKLFIDIEAYGVQSEHNGSTFETISGWDR